MDGYVIFEGQLISCEDTIQEPIMKQCLGDKYHLRSKSQIFQPEYENEDHQIQQIKDKDNFNILDYLEILNSHYIDLQTEKQQNLKKQEKINFFTQFPFFQSSLLTQKKIEDFYKKSTQIKNYTTKQKIYQTGDEITQIFFIKYGVIEISQNIDNLDQNQSSKLISSPKKQIDSVKNSNFQNDESNNDVDNGSSLSQNKQNQNLNLNINKTNNFKKNYQFQKQKLINLSTNSIFGHEEIAQNLQFRTFTATATQDTSLLVVKLQDFYNFLQKLETVQVFKDFANQKQNFLQGQKSLIQQRINLNQNNYKKQNQKIQTFTVPSLNLNLTHDNKEENLNTYQNIKLNNNKKIQRHSSQQLKNSFYKDNKSQTARNFNPSEKNKKQQIFADKKDKNFDLYQNFKQKVTSILSAKKNLFHKIQSLEKNNNKNQTPNQIMQKNQDNQKYLDNLSISHKSQKLQQKRFSSNPVIIQHQREQNQIFSKQQQYLNAKRQSLSNIEDPQDKIKNFIKNQNKNNIKPQTQTKKQMQTENQNQNLNAHFQEQNQIFTQNDISEEDDENSEDDQLSIEHFNLNLLNEFVSKSELKESEKRQSIILAQKTRFSKFSNNKNINQQVLDIATNNENLQNFQSVIQNNSLKPSSQTNLNEFNNQKIEKNSLNQEKFTHFISSQNTRSFSQPKKSAIEAQTHSKPNIKNFSQNQINKQNYSDKKIICSGLSPRKQNLSLQKFKNLNLKTQPSLFSERSLIDTSTILSQRSLIGTHQQKSLRKYDNLNQISQNFNNNDCQVNFNQINQSEYQLPFQLQKQNLNFNNQTQNLNKKTPIKFQRNDAANLNNNQQNFNSFQQNEYEQDLYKKVKNNIQKNLQNAQIIKRRSTNCLNTNNNNFKNNFKNNNNDPISPIAFRQSSYNSNLKIQNTEKFVLKTESSQQEDLSLLQNSPLRKKIGVNNYNLNLINQLKNKRRKTSSMVSEKQPSTYYDTQKQQSKINDRSQQYNFSYFEENLLNPSNQNCSPRRLQTEGNSPYTNKNKDEKSQLLNEQEALILTQSNVSGCRKNSFSLLNRSPTQKNKILHNLKQKIKPKKQSIDKINHPVSKIQINQEYQINNCADIEINSPQQKNSQNQVKNLQKTIHYQNLSETSMIIPKQAKNHNYFKIQKVPSISPQKSKKVQNFTSEIQKLSSQFNKQKSQNQTQNQKENQSQNQSQSQNNLNQNENKNNQNQNKSQNYTGSNIKLVFRNPVLIPNNDFQVEKCGKNINNQNQLVKKKKSNPDEHYYQQNLTQLINNVSFGQNIK
ncbi:Cyclic nucleotide-binding protein [Pseudocohnilembus persalinus]|uniref:Cyclic nucleotide-binding protein n=1 Tax=Pseudocohnilembus persalinus TaxID=266149 RepID=A0A0V0QF14_PSEPJ|nr:Cyclic nucleotide-binding protein [Pseudocohnilembus persalinus]|eukprot:KRX00791.1 Cyclic nucleotide-binding protein [Pseudocohnilembus persalinus]